ncbi:MAG: sulfurtransferase [bacterium]|nr:sulfurtransferase [bacterium]
MRVTHATLCGIAVTHLLVMLLACGPSPSSDQDGPGVGDSARVRYHLLVTTQWLAEHLDEPNVKVLHVGRGREEYEAGHIAGARFLPWEEIAVTRDGIPNELPDPEHLTATVRSLGIEDGDRIVLYDGGKGVAAARAYVTFDYLGLGDAAALLDGQLAKWQAEQRPVVTEEPEVTPSTFEPRLRPELVVALAEMEDLVRARNDPSQDQPALLDTRPEENFTGEVPGRDIPRGGHIPGGVHAFWEEHLADSEVPVMRPPVDLLRLYSAAGVEPGDRVVTYCRTGVQAAHTYFVLKYLGYDDVRLYDASFIEWSAVDGVPVDSGASP